MSKQTRQKFLVVSYDDDQQQWFWDFVAASAEHEAVALVCKRRPYVIAADAASLAQVQEIADSLKSRSVSYIASQFRWDTSDFKQSARRS